MAEAADDQNADTCRICSGPAEPNQPLFHPCKCSGTIRYIHQDCLTTWLQHSKKKTCDVCKAEYAFEKVYDPNMPDRLPPFLFARRLAVQMFHWQLFGLRAMFVSSIWLALMPYTTVLVWRAYFWAGESLAWRSYGEPKPAHYQTAETTRNYTLKDVAESLARLEDLDGHELLKNLWSDIFEGQIIASLIIVLFLAIFLLREFIVQNARPGILGDPVVVDAAPDGVEAAHPPDGADDVVAERLPPLIPLAPAPDLDLDPNPLDVAPVVNEVAWIGPGSLDQPSGGNPDDADDDDGEWTDDDGDEELDQLPEDPDEARERVRKQRERYFGPQMSDAALPSASNPVRPILLPQNTGSSSSGASSSKDSLLLSSALKAPGIPAAKRKRLMSVSEAPVPWDETQQAAFAIIEPSPYDASFPPKVIDASAVPLPPSRSVSQIDFSGVVPKERRRRPWRAPTAAVRRATRDDEDDGESDDSANSPETKDGLDKWVENNPNFTFQVPEGWQLTSFSSSSLPTSTGFGQISNPSVAGSSTFTFVSGPSRPPSTTWDVIPSNSSSPSPPLSTTPLTLRRPANTSSLALSSEETPSVSPKLNGAVPTSSGRTSPGQSTSLPRRPGLPPTTPNEELPPPSPRPSHARPSPLPRKEGPTIAGPSPLRDIAIASSSSFAPPASGLGTPNGSVGATYRAPEDLDVNAEPAWSSYFPRPQTPPLPSGYFDPGDQDQGPTRGRGLKLVNDDGDDQEQEAEDVKQNEAEETEDDDDEMPQLERVLPAPIQIEAVPGERERARLEARLEEIIRDQAPVGGGADDGDENAELEAAEMAEDDMEGLLEAVGMRGPFLAIVQNVSLMVFILDTTIGVAVFLPYLLGKSVALNMMKPTRILYLLHLPIKAVRLITDPVVDGLVWFIRPAATHFFRVFNEVLRLRATESETTHINLDVFYEHAIKRLAQVAPVFARLSAVHSVQATSPSLLSAARAHITERLEPILTVLSSKILTTSPDGVSDAPSKMHALLVGISASWERLAIQNGEDERLFAIALGYSTIALVLGLFVASGSILNGTTKLLRGFVAQQLVLLKVAMFILIELALFPFGCGVFLDISTLPLFPGVTIRSRLQYCTASPISALFFHWMLGTMFMYQFAMVLSAARSILRKGALWFVKDPQDPTFHPIRDILDRPTLVQLNKLAISAAMYGMVIVGGVGTVVYALRYLWTPFYHLLPLRWNSRRPLSEVPIDLLFLHIVLPGIVNSLQLRNAAGTFFQSWWEHAAHEFRLTSYLFGERYVEEEVPSRFTWKRLPLVRDIEWVRSLDQQETRASTARERRGNIRDDGGFARVPASDNVAFPEDPKMKTQMLVPTNEAGAPFDERGSQLIEAQNDAARKAHRNVVDDYQIIYLPPHFNIRVSFFIGYIWLTGATLGILVLGTPVLLGRRVLDLFDKVPAHTHDGYSFIVGGTVIWAIFFAVAHLIEVGRHLSRLHYDINLDTQRQSAPDSQRYFALAKLYLSQIPRAFVWAGKHIAVWTMLGFVIPLLMAVTLELYLILPVRIAATGETEAPTIHIWEDWALGCVLATIALRMGRMDGRRNRFVRAWDEMLQHAPIQLDIRIVTKDLIAPLFNGLLALILVPALVPYVLFKVLHLAIPENYPLRTIYPSLFVGAALIAAIERASRMLDRWAVTVRDKEYLVDLRLQNLEDAEKRSKQQRARANERPDHVDVAVGPDVEIL